MLAGKDFESSRAGKRISCIDAAGWMKPLGHTASSLCQKHQTMPYLHKFINFYLIQSRGFVFFWFTLLHGDSYWQHLVVWGQAYGRQTCWTNQAVEGKENLVCFYCDSTSHKCMTITVTLCLCCSPGNAEKQGLARLPASPSPAYLASKGSSLPLLFLACWTRLQQRTFVGNCFQLDTAPAQVCFFAVQLCTIMKASLSTFVPWVSPHRAAQVAATYLFCSERLPTSETSLPSRQNLLEGLSSHSVGRFSLGSSLKLSHHNWDLLCLFIFTTDMKIWLVPTSAIAMFLLRLPLF